MPGHDISMWRVGRKVGRTIYAQLSDKPSDQDSLIGLMDTPELAARAVLDHTRNLTSSRLVEAERLLADVLNYRTPFERSHRCKLCRGYVGDALPIQHADDCPWPRIEAFTPDPP